MKTLGEGHGKYDIVAAWQSIERGMRSMISKYHFVWIPKYRKSILTKELKKRVEKLFREIAEQCEFETDVMEVMSDHAHIFLSAPPKYSPAKIVEVLKNVGSKRVFEEFPWLENYL